MVSVADFIEWDVRNWGAALSFWTAHSEQDLAVCSALEIGSRNGGLSLWLAIRGAKVVCSDITGPRQEAILKHTTAGVSHLIEYERIDGTRIPYTNQFDVVIFKSVLGAVGARQGQRGQAKAIAEMHKALRSGGELFFAENLVASPVHQFLRRRFTPWAARWKYVSVTEMRQFLGLFTQVTYRTVGFAGAFGRSRVLQNVLGNLDRMFLDRMVPERWRYIIVGVARK
jgi:SAM-dependent methyltransferase